MKNLFKTSLFSPLTIASYKSEVLFVNYYVIFFELTLLNTDKKQSFESDIFALVLHQVKAIKLLIQRAVREQYLLPSNASFIGLPPFMWLTSMYFVLMTGSK